MKIITVNLEKEVILAMKPLVGDTGLYPSRSELVRVALRDFLLEQIKIAQLQSPKDTTFAVNLNSLCKEALDSYTTKKNGMTHTILEGIEK